MALRVDDILVSEKNVFLFDGGRHYVADIEPSRSKGDGNRRFKGNLWNLFSADGTAINNIYDASDFLVRTQSLTTLTRKSGDDRDAHENFFMPQPSCFVGMCQLYGNAYALTTFSTDAWNCSYSLGTGRGEERYDSGCGFVQYPPLDEFRDSVDTSISPEMLYMPSCGAQYMTEFPFNGFYTDFGGVDDSSAPTMYGDSVLVKYYLDHNFSVSAVADTAGRIRFRGMREYNGIGTTGNSIYLTFKNRLMGSNDDYGTLRGGDATTENPFIDISIFSTGFSFDTLGCLDSVTMVATDKESRELFVSDSPLHALSNADAGGGYVMERQSRNGTFMLYFRKGRSGGGIAGMTFIPQDGVAAARVDYDFAISESAENLSIVELDDCILVGTESNGLVAVWTRGYTFDAIPGYGSFNPFHLVTVYTDGGNPIQSNDSSLSGFKLFWNGDDIVAAVCHDDGGGEGGGGLVFLTTKYTDAVTDVVHNMGEKWWVATSTDEPIPVEGQMSSRSSYVASNVMFDYCPSEVDGLHVGNYVFLQFENDGDVVHGLRKIYVGDIPNSTVQKVSSDSDSMKHDVFAVFSSAGEVNRVAPAARRAQDVHFILSSYPRSLYDSAVASVFFAGSGSTTVTAKPALRASWSSGDKHEESFAVLPLESGRAVVEATMYGTKEVRPVEQLPIDVLRFSMDQPIRNSMGISMYSLDPKSPRHGSAPVLVKWNEPGGTFQGSFDCSNPEQSVDGLHLQYSSICTDILVTGQYYGWRRKRKSHDRSWQITATSNIFEYPHPTFGDFATAGTGIRIFDGALDGSMKIGDFFMLNGHFVVTNYRTKPRESVKDGTLDPSAKQMNSIVPEYAYGGYVVSSYYSEGGTDSELYSSTEVLNRDSGGPTGSRDFSYSYLHLFHIESNGTIPMYPASEEGKTWKPYYHGKHVDSIQYHNGYYYIILRTMGEKNADGRGFELIETKSLYGEQPTISLDRGRYINRIRFAGDFVEVEYANYVTDSGDVEIEPFVVFKQGYPTIRRRLMFSSISNPEGVFDVAKLVDNGSTVSFIFKNLVFDIPRETLNDSITTASAIYSTFFSDMKAVGDGTLVASGKNRKNVPSLCYSGSSNALMASITPTDIASPLSSITVVDGRVAIICDGSLVVDAEGEKASGNGVMFVKNGGAPAISELFVGVGAAASQIDSGNFKLCTSFVHDGIAYCVVKNLTDGKFYISRDWMEYGRGYGCGELFAQVDHGFGDADGIECIKAVSCVRGSAGKLLFVRKDGGQWLFSEISLSDTVQLVNGVSVPKQPAAMRYGPIVAGISGMPVSLSTVAIGGIISTVANTDEGSLFVFDFGGDIGTIITAKKVVADGLTIAEALPPHDSYDGVNCDGYPLVVEDGDGMFAPCRLVQSGNSFSPAKLTGVEAVQSYRILRGEDGRLMAFVGIEDEVVKYAVDYFSAVHSEMYDITEIDGQQTIVPLEGMHKDIAIPSVEEDADDEPSDVTDDDSESGDSTASYRHVIFVVSELQAVKNGYVVYLTSSETYGDGTPGYENRIALVYASNIRSVPEFFNSNSVVYESIVTDGLSPEADETYFIFENGAYSECPSLTAFEDGVNYFTARDNVQEFDAQSDEGITIRTSPGKIGDEHMATVLTFGTYSTLDDGNVHGNALLTTVDEQHEGLSFLNLADAKDVTYAITSDVVKEDVYETSLDVVPNRSTEAHVSFDNVETLYSFNRFTPTTCHKSNLFSIRIGGLGIDESPYLTDEQKSNMKRWLSTTITEMVDGVKPSNTQLFDVFIN